MEVGLVVVRFRACERKFWSELELLISVSMATRNRTVQFRKHRDAVKSVRAPLSSSASGSGGPVIEMASLLGSNRSSYAPLSSEEDPGPSR